MKGWQHVIYLKPHCETAPTSHTSKYTLPLSSEEESALSEINAAVTDLSFSYGRLLFLEKFVSHYSYRDFSVFGFVESEGHPFLQKHQHNLFIPYLLAGPAHPTQGNTLFVCWSFYDSP